MEGWAKKIVLKVKSEKELREIFMAAKKSGIISVMIKDAGHTQIAAGSITAVSLGPEDEKKLDPITGKLKLL